MDEASPQAIAAAAKRYGADSVAYTYNDPVIFTKYAIDTALACRELGIRNVAAPPATSPRACPDLFAVIDAVNVNIKAFTASSTTDSARPPRAGTRRPHLLPPRNRLLARDHDAAHPRPNDSPDEINQLATWVGRNSGRTCRCTSPPSTPTGSWRTSRRRHPGPDPSPPDRPRPRPSSRLHRQRPRRRRRLHPLPELPRLAHHPRLVRLPPLQRRPRSLPACHAVIAGRFGPVLGHDGRAFGPQADSGSFGSVMRSSGFWPF